MRKVLLALAGVGVVLTAAPVGAKDKTYVCTKWKDGVCLSAHRVKGTPPARAVGYVFGPTYTYTPYGELPQPVVTYYKLGEDSRYVYSDGYIYVIDPATFAITRVIDTLSR